MTGIRNIIIFLRIIKVTSHAEGNNIVFDAESDKQCFYTLVLKFNNLQGYQSFQGSEATISIKPGFNGAIYKLKRDVNDKSPRFRYSYTYHPGKYDAKPVMNYPYILPATVGKELSTAKYIGTNISGIVFEYNGLDTICAIRSGHIIHMQNNQLDEKGFIYHSEYTKNTITVEHADGSFARYLCITPVRCLLEEGERIVAGQPIAVFTKEEDSQSMGIHIFHLAKDLKYKSITPQFYTTEGLSQLNFEKKYRSTSTKEIIEKELTKKEKKLLNL